jgi:hypothetical protein
MTKRSAITMAAGLAVALLVGVAAISLTFGGAPVANAGRDNKPVVKHQVQTVTVHRKADAPATGGVRIVHLSSTAPTASATMSGSSDDDGFEDEADELNENEANDDGFDDGSHQGSFSSGSYEDD